jgi:LPS-assembly protein
LRRRFFDDSFSDDGAPMSLRNKFLITATLLCHWILVPPLVTSQLLSAASDLFPQKAERTDASTPCGKKAESLATDNPVICAIQQEKDGAIYKLHGQVEIHYSMYVLRADEVTYNSDSGDATASGHFTLDGGLNDDHIKASHGSYNVTTETGRFYDVTGTTGVRFHGSRVVLTSTSPFVFTGKVVEKTGSDHYVVFDGTVTTCELPRPKWQFNAHKVVVDVGGNASIYRSAFLLHGIPVLYLPYATHPVQPEVRQTGFLVPSIGRSSNKGNIVGDSFYWAINQSMDATVGAEYFSSRGWSQRGEFRARPSDSSYVDLNYFGVLDRGLRQSNGQPPVKQGGENARLDAEWNSHGFRGVANIDYLSSYLFRLAFNEVFTQAAYSEVKSQAFLSKSMAGFFFNGRGERYQDFQSTNAGDVVTISHAPSFDMSSVDQRLGRSPFYWAFDTALGGLSRSEPGFTPVPLVGRFDLSPDISLPLLSRGWSVRPELILHSTYYTKRLIPGENIAQDNSIYRQALETAVELRPPSLERVFDTPLFGRKWKNVIEPRVVYRRVTGINNFADILRFDERDILSDTHEVEYGFVTRLYAKRTLPIEDCGTDMPSLTVGAAAPEQTVPWDRPIAPQKSPCTVAPGVHEVATWELTQEYFVDPTFGGALVPGQRNVFSSTADLTGIAFATQPRHLSPIISRLRVETSERTDMEWDLDYDFQLGRINASTFLANYHVGPFTVGGGDAFLQIPQPPTATTPGFTQKFQQFRVALGYGSLNKRGLSAASSFGIDAESGLLQFATAQTSYNWDCCGMTVEYRRYALANVRNENLFRFTFSLANIGSFGNLRRQQRLY